MNENKQLKAVYNGSEIITSNGFTMQSNYVVPVLARMVNEGLLLQSGMDVVQAILSFKHTEENPYPTRETIAEYLGKGIDYVKKALKSIKETGILSVEKSGRKSTYSFKPFFALLEKFIVEFKEKKNLKVKIAELLKMKVVKKKDQDFSWSEETTKGKEVVAEETVEVIEVAEEVPAVPVLPEKLQKVLEANNISEAGVKVVEDSFKSYGDDLEVEIFIQKVIASATKKDFVVYYTTCINNAYTSGEKYQAPTVQNSASTGYNKGKGTKVPRNRAEEMPNWEKMQDPNQVPLTEEEKMKAQLDLQHRLANMRKNKEGVK